MINEIIGGGSYILTRLEQKEATRRRIFQTAVDVFRERGVEETPVEDIVRRASVSKGTFFFHFPTKDHIFSVYVDMLADEMMAQVPRWAELPGMAGVEAALEAMHQRAEEDRMLLPHVVRVELFGEPLDDGRPSALQDVFRPLVSRAQADGQIRKDLPVETCVQHVLSNYLIAVAWVIRKGGSLRPVLHEALTLAVEGLRPNPGGRGGDRL